MNSIIEYQNVIYKQYPGRAKKEKIRGLNAVPGSKAHAAKFHKPLLDLNPNMDAGTIKTAIKNAFPFNQSTLFYGKMIHASYENCGLDFTILVYKQLTITPRVDPLVM